MECEDLSKQETQTPPPPKQLSLVKETENKDYKALEGKLPLIFVQELMSAMKGSTHFKEDDRLFLTLAYSVIFLPALVMTNFPWPQLFTSSFSLQLHWCSLCSTCI